MGTNVQENNSLLKWVETKAEVTYSYNLYSDDKWHQFPDLALTVHIPIGQRVLIQYNIQNWIQDGSRLMTKVLIDGAETHRIFRIGTGYGYFHNHQTGSQVWLEKGTHTIEIQYRLSHSFREGGQTLQDWNCAILMVGYYIQ